jgi:hypothetical protein
MLQAAVGRPFTCAIDPRTGEVPSLRGFEEIRALVRAGHMQGLIEMGMTKGQVDAFVNGVFDDEFIRRSMDGLTRVRGDSKRVPWRGPTAEGEGDGIAFQARPVAPAPIVLRSLTLPPDGGDLAIFVGTSRYAGGRVERAELKQELVQAGGRRCVMRWSMTLAR